MGKSCAKGGAVDTGADIGATAQRGCVVYLLTFGAKDFDRVRGNFVLDPYG